MGFRRRRALVGVVVAVLVAIVMRDDLLEGAEAVV